MIRPTFGPWNLVAAVSGVVCAGPFAMAVGAVVEEVGSG